MKQLTVKKAIKLYCLECCGGSRNEVVLCPVKECVLYPFRKRVGGRASVKLIRKHCYQCGEGTSDAIKKCEFKDKCVLYDFRLGKLPPRQKDTMQKS
jgi:hypothetical protein